MSNTDQEPQLKICLAYLIKRATLRSSVMKFMLLKLAGFKQGYQLIQQEVLTTILHPLLKIHFTHPSIELSTKVHLNEVASNDKQLSTPQAN